MIWVQYSAAFLLVLEKEEATKTWRFRNFGIDFEGSNELDSSTFYPMKNRAQKRALNHWKIMKSAKSVKVVYFEVDT